MEILLGWFVVSFIFFLIAVAILRWAFRVNAIVERLDTISKQLTRLAIQNNQDTSHEVVICGEKRQ